MVRTKNTNLLSVSILIVFESIELNAVLVYDYRQGKKRDQGHSSATVKRSGIKDIHKEKKQNIDQSLNMFHSFPVNSLLYRKSNEVHLLYRG